MKKLLVTAIALSLVVFLFTGCGTDENDIINKMNKENKNVPVTLKWTYKTGFSRYSSSAVVDGVVYVGDQEDYIYAIDKDNGKLIWQFYEPKIFFPPLQ